MRRPDWRHLVLSDGVLREPLPDQDRILVWLPAGQDGGFQLWERVGNAARPEIRTEQGVCSTEATSIRARQRVRGAFGKLLGGFRGGATTDRTLTLPDGRSAERWGERQTDLVLAWAEDETRPLDEARIKARWPECRGLRKIGDDLFLVSGVKPRAPRTEPEPGPAEVDPREHAERLLAAARKAGDRRGEVAALTDLGILSVKEGDAGRAVGLLEEALVLTRLLGDRSRECDVVINLGLATSELGQFRRALEFYEQGLAYARASGDGLAEKLALEHMGVTHANLGDPARSLGFYDQALALAHHFGDRQQEANLLWHQGIQHAVLGQRAQAIARAQEAVDLLRKMGKPHHAWFAEHLKKYRGGDAGTLPGGIGEAGRGVSFGGSIVTSGVGGRPGQGDPSGTAAGGPGLLRMALTATQSMARFLGSGFKTTPPEVVRERLGTCAGCEHHTGLRCRICGCFTDAKARLLHEECPLGKWPA